LRRQLLKSGLRILLRVQSGKISQSINNAWGFKKISKRCKGECCVPALSAVRELSALVPRENFEEDLPRRLYVGRGDIRIRDVENEDALLALLGEYGFQKILCSEYPVDMQIRLARNADYIVCTHGAAGTKKIVDIRISWG
jgi:hypothetical protein